MQQIAYPKKVKIGGNKKVVWGGVCKPAHIRALVRQTWGCKGIENSKGKMQNSKRINKYAYLKIL